MGLGAGQRVALFVPCFIDQVCPRVAQAAMDLMGNAGVEVHVPPDQTCCGQPMANVGCIDEAASLARHYVSVFSRYDYVVCPSASCTAMVRRQYRELLSIDNSICERTYEVCEFLVGVMQVERIEGRFEHRVGLHQGCHGLRELRMGESTERIGVQRDPIAQLLGGLQGIEIVALEHRDECCGFGGSFSIDEPGVSARMGDDRVSDHRNAGAEVIVSADMSCLLHLEGVMRRQGNRLPVMHVAEVLAGRAVDLNYGSVMP